MLLVCAGALALAALAPGQQVIIRQGQVLRDGAAPKPEDVAKIKAAILINHGGLDKPAVDGWPAQEAALKKYNIRYEGHIWPNSVHGFFNDATPERYNKLTAQEAWTRTIEWFNQYVRGTPA